MSNIKLSVYQSYEELRPYVRRVLVALGDEDTNETIPIGSTGFSISRIAGIRFSFITAIGMLNPMHSSILPDRSMMNNLTISGLNKAAG